MGSGVRFALFCLLVGVAAGAANYPRIPQMHPAPHVSPPRPGDNQAEDDEEDRAYKKLFDHILNKDFYGWLEAELDYILNPCPENFTFFPYTGKCYWPSSREHGLFKTWQGARDDCEYRGGNLASFHTRYEQQFLSNICTAVRPDAPQPFPAANPPITLDCWVGGKTDSNGVWSWINGEVFGDCPLLVSDGLVTLLGMPPSPNPLPNRCLVVYTDDNKGAGIVDLDAVKTAGITSAANLSPAQMISCGASKRYVCERAPLPRPEDEEEKEKTEDPFDLLKHVFKPSKTHPHPSKELHHFLEHEGGHDELYKRFLSQYTSQYPLVDRFILTERKRVRRMTEEHKKRKHGQHYPMINPPFLGEHDPSLKSRMTAYIKKEFRKFLLYELAFILNPCERDWVFFPTTGKCYFHSYGDERRFDDAERACVALGGHLASFHSEAEKEFLKDFCTAGNVVLPNDVDTRVPCWVGGHRSGPGQPWNWTDTSVWGDINEIINYNVPIPFEPLANCMAVNPNDADGASRHNCQRQYFYACQKDAIQRPKDKKHKDKDDDKDDKGKGTPRLPLFPVAVEPPNYYQQPQPYAQSQPYQAGGLPIRPFP